MASSINATKPTTGSPTTQSVRDNFSAAKNEINALLRSSLDLVVTTGSGAAYVADFSNNVVKAEGARIIVKAHAANTGSATLNVDGTGASTIRTTDGAVLSAGQIAGSNHYLDLVYNSANNSWVLLNPKGLIAQLDTARLIALGGNVTGSTSFDGSQNVTITTVVDKLLPYPVGSIYTSTNSANPSTLFGGTWAAFGAGRVLVGRDYGGGAFDAGGQTGGSETSTATSSVSRDGWGSYQSSGGFPEPSTSGRLVTGSGQTEPGEKLESQGHASSNKSVTSSAFSVLQPYVVVYMWKRTA